MKKYICVMLVIVAIAFAGTITKTFRYSESNLIFNRADNYVIPTIAGQLTTEEVGSPCLPMATYQVLVPASAKVTSITIQSSDKVDLPGVYNVMPVTEPQPLSVSDNNLKFHPNIDVYSMTTAYPGKLVDFSATGSKSGYRICGFSIYPVQYIPSEGKLTLYTNITVKISYEENVVQPISLTNMQKDIFEREIRTMVINPEDIPLFAPQERRPLNQTNYLLITTDAFASYFQPLVDWRTKQGFNGAILTVNTISSTYPGRDLAEKIRNAIIDYYRNHGLIFVVLGGDYLDVPKRGVYATCSGYTETSMPCDLYFSDLTGSWDGDHDSTFGEVPGDSIDFYPDVYVGRASVSNTAQATTFVNKVLTFEKNPPTDYLKRMLLPSVMLFSQYNWHGHITNDSIAAITPAGWTDRSIMDPTTITPMRDSLNNGFEFCHVTCHGNEVGFYTASSQLIYGTATASSQANGNKLFILNSIACLTGSFDYSSDCLAEAMMHNANGGAVATIQNSRDGWGMPPNNLGPSEWMDVKFYDFLFNKDSFYIGVAHARSKSMYTAQGLSDDCWRWCIYELNLFGDPAMPMWTDVPQNITAQYPQVVPLGPSNIVVNVTRSGVPVNHALVSIQKGAEVYEQGYTNIMGSATIPITTTSAGHINLTITAQNCYPYEDSAVVQANGPYVNYLKSTLVDSISDHCDSIPNPGEAINMQTWVKNWGNQPASNVTSKLTSTSTNVTITDSMKSFGTVPANDSAFSGINGFRYTIAPSCTNGVVIPLRLTCRDASDSAWNSYVYIRVGTPVFNFRDRTVYDPAPGNNNGRIDPGETADLIVTLANTGYGNGYDVYGVLRSTDAQLQVMDSVGNFGTIEHDTTGFNPIDRFTVRASSSSSPGTTVTCSLKVYSEGVYMNTVGFSLIIGEFRPIDPIPDGPRTPVRYWAYDNIDTLYAERPVYNWVEIKNIGTRLSYNQNDQVRNVPLANFGTLKFFGQNYNSISISVDGWIACGNDTNHAYSNMPLPSSSAQPAMICANWDDLYHSNSGIGGIYWYYNTADHTLIVEWDSLYYYAATTTRDKFEVIFYDSTYTTPTGDNIFLVQYMTANLTNSSTVGIQDETRTIGLQYLYNGTYHPAAGGLVAGRAIKYTTASPITGIADDYTVNSIKRVVLYQNRPNPFTNHTLINYNVTKLGKVSIGIYDATGRLIKTLVNGTQDIGSYTLQWNGRDEKNNQVAQGIYFCRLVTDNATAIRKMTLVK